MSNNEQNFDSLPIKRRVLRIVSLFVMPLEQLSLVLQTKQIRVVHAIRSLEKTGKVKEEYSHRWGFRYWTTIMLLMLCLTVNGAVTSTNYVWTIQYSINLKSTNWWTFNNMKFTNTYSTCHVGLSKTNYPITIFFRAKR